MEKLQHLSQAELQDLLDDADRVQSLALESDEVLTVIDLYRGLCCV